MFYISVVISTSVEGGAQLHHTVEEIGLYIPPLTQTTAERRRLYAASRDSDTE